MDKMTLSDTEKTGTGNTSKVRSRYWFFTLNNYENKDIIYIEDVLNTETQEYCFQEETGDEGTRHLQGCIRYKNARSFRSIKKLLPRAHIERCKNWKAAVRYCSKADTRHGSTFTNIKGMKPEIKLKDKFTKYTPYNYQSEILEILKEEPDDRTIHWYWEPDGNTGKSTFTRHICINYNAIVISGKATDMKNAILQMDIKPEVIIIDIPRSNLDYISYAGIEEIKNGCFFSGKYEGGMCIFNPPHIICFANAKPETRKLSSDRWNIKRINIKG